MVGMLTGQTMDVVVVLMAEVKWDAQCEFVPVDVLEPFDVEEDTSFEGLVAAGRYERIETLRSLITFEKLFGALSNVMYSMQTADIRFFAHQFVPVLKFVQSPLGRLLIADEVGLGKTIEAGLIWTECRARFKARRLLVICTPTLVPKWIRELQDKFAIEATYADASDLRDKFEGFTRQGTAQSFALVSSYHALRPRKGEKSQLKPWLNEHRTEFNIERVDSMEPWKPRPDLFRSLLEWDGEPFIDLVVFDEAHLMKNTATANHLVGDVFSSSSQSALALSATPLTTKSRDLFSLLSLVDPDMFRDEGAFNDLCRRNRPAVLLISELARPTIRPEKCLELLDQIPDSAAQRHLNNRIQTMGDANALAEADKIELQSKAGRLNELGAFLTRTRKVEITEGKATRVPVTLVVEPTRQELVFYNSVLRRIRRRVAERGDVLSIFHLIGPALSMTSCLPVMAERLRSGESNWGDLQDLAELENAYMEEESESEFVGENHTHLLGDLSWIPDYDFEHADTKYAQLRNELLKRDGEGKVIVFAFFKGTLAYLKRRLEGDGFTCQLVTGDIQDTAERDRRLQEFISSDHRILLCSEVAAEGVDLQFCRIMVNYDLPWNPMRVEQRIGRIDRIGQQAKTIVIINFHVRGTIDGSIYQHLYAKIGIFEQTIGDLEGILGSYVNQLTLELLANELSEEQTEERIRLAAEAIARERAVVAQIDEESETLLGLRSYLQSNITQGRSLGRYIKPSELRLFTVEFFRQNYVGPDSCQLMWDTPAEGCLRLVFSFRALSDFESYLQQQSSPWPKGIDRAGRSVTLTFDPAIHEDVRRRHRSVILSNHLHPLVRWMTTSLLATRKQWHPASALRLITNAAEPGVYMYFVLRVSLKHPALSREELLFRMRDVTTGRTLSRQDSELLLNGALEQGFSWLEPAGFPDATEALDLVWKTLVRDCTEIHESFIEELELRLNSKRAQVESHFRRRLETAHRRLEAMQVASGPRNKGIRVTQSQINHLRERLAEELAKLDRFVETSPEHKRVACGLVKITRSS